MMLKEFFGKAVNIDKHMAKTNQNQGLGNDLFWFIIDHNKLHKDYLHPIAKKIYQAQKSNKVDKEILVKEFMPMVRKGCQEYYNFNKMPGNFEDNFSQKMLDELCERLYDHYKDDIASNKQYKLGV